MYFNKQAEAKALYLTRYNKVLGEHNDKRLLLICSLLTPLLIHLIRDRGHLSGQS